MTGNEHVEIYSLDGSLIIRRKPDGNKATAIQTAPGIYVVRVMPPNGKATTKKVVVS
jgi:hypothetical protein